MQNNFVPRGKKKSSINAGIRDKRVRPNPGETGFYSRLRAKFEISGVDCIVSAIRHLYYFNAPSKRVLLLFQKLSLLNDPNLHIPHNLKVS